MNAIKIIKSPRFRNGVEKGVIQAFDLGAAFWLDPEPASVKYRRRRAKGVERLRQSFHKSWEELSSQVEKVKG